ncbi:MAG: MFS transporter [Gammaproteobacteria bacterium MedPE]|nr:MAG: MFS transporter [Gammaproteobacteria bacterium MedPE]
MSSQGQFSLFSQRRFLPYFVTQALGAFNDNLYKNTLLLFIALFAVDAQQSGLLTNIAAGLFILPFFLFSAIGGQIADKYEKSKLIRIIKLAEIAIMVIGALALMWQQTNLMLVVLFLMGTQSAFFGPVKFSLLPQHLDKSELVGGNGLIEMGTFLAILGGTILAGVLFEFEQALIIIAVAVIGFAFIGYVASRSIPNAPANNPELKVNYNPLTSIKHTIGNIKQERPLFLSILAISWFWFLGAGYLTQFPAFAINNLGGNTQLVTLLLVVFSFGVGLGSILCERLSGHTIELGIIPIGSIGMSIFGIDIYFAAQSVMVIENMTAMEFINHPQNYRLLADLLLLAVFSGIYVVPLNALIQTRGDDKCRAQIIAANNVLNALFMVLSAILAIVLLSVLELSIAQYFLVLGIANLVVAGYIYSQVTEFVLRFIIWIISHTMYRVKHQGISNIPDEGAAVLVCNHVSFVDALLIAGSSRRPVRFVMDKSIANMPIMKYVFKWAKTIPICSPKQDIDTYNKAFEQIQHELNEGELVCIFPEGKITKDGTLNEFRGGIEKILKNNPVPVVPMALTGLWGSFFSHKDGHAFTTKPRRFWSRVGLIVDEPIAAQEASANTLQTKVQSIITTHS